jgi:protein-tyrosine phosphatase
VNPTLTPTPLANLRSLAGTPTAHGPVRENVLWRADDVTVAPREQLEALRASGLSTIVDLRSDQEIAATGPGHAPRLGLAVHHVPLSAASADPASVARSFSEITTAEQVGAWYAASIRDYAPALVGILRLIAEAPGGTLFHCAAGKDRTGMTAAAVLGVLGTPEEAIVADYARTDANMPGVMGRWGTRPVSPGIDRSVIPPAGHPLMGAKPAAMAATLEALDGAAGLASLLRSAGLDAGLEASLVERLVGR